MARKQTYEEIKEREAELLAAMNTELDNEIKNDEVVVEPVAEPEPEAKPEPLHDSYKDKYDTLAGKYNTETGELSKTVKEQQAKINELLALVAESNKRIVELSKTETKPVESKPEPTPVDTGIKLDSNKYLTPKDEEDFADFVDVARRAAKQEIEIALSGFVNDKLMPYLESKFTPFLRDIDDVKSITINSVRERFYEKMDQLCPTWESINVDPGFKAWLTEPDTFSEIPRQKFLNDYSEQNDAKRCAKIFNTYIKEVGSTETPVNLNSADNTIDIVKEPEVEPLPNTDAFIAPVNRPSNAPPVVEKPVKILARDYVARAMEDYKNHKIDFNEVRARQKEFEIAVSEGRVA